MRKDSRLDDFLAEREIVLYDRQRFAKNKTRDNPLVSISYSSFLDENFRVKKHLFPLLQKTIKEHGLKVYFVMVSWWGRGEQARWTGGYLMAALQKFKEQGFCEVLLSYQEGEKRSSSLCKYCQRKKIPVLYADKYQLVDSKDREVVVPRKAVGKAENVIKAVKLVEERARKAGIPPEKVLVVFVDDDYTQYHWINYFLLFAPWVLSFQRETGDREVDNILHRIKKVSFIKSGSPRIILPYEIQEQIVAGNLKPLDYLGIALEIIELACVHQRFGFSKEREIVNELIIMLLKIREKEQVFSPANKAHFLGDRYTDLLQRVWREYIYRGGRVTQRLESIFRYMSHKKEYRWLRQFTFILHGDQGAPLDAWLEFSPFAGYALEISLLVQAVWDRVFQNQQVLNIVTLPHSHQRSKELAIWNMLDTILLALDLSRLLYGDLSLKAFLSLYKYQHQYSMLNRYGEVISHQPSYRGLKIYPPLKNLTLEG